MRKRLISALAIALILTVAGCGGNSSKEASTKNDKGEAKQVFHVAIGSELPTADVSLAMDNVSVEAMSQFMEGLYEFDVNGDVQPALAAEIAKPSKDGLVYTIKLKEDGKWSNGDNVTAKDFVYSWQRTVDPATAAEQSYYFEGIKNYEAIAKGELPPTELGIKAVNDYELELTLEHPIPYINSLIAIPAFFPMNQKFVEEQGDKFGTSSETTLSNGPFTLEDWNGTSMSWKYVKNDQYREKDEVDLDEVQMQVIKETSSGINLFKDGQLDDLVISGEFVAHEQDNEALQIREMPGTYYISYNTKKEILSNLKAREAISLVIDSDQIAKNVLNDGSKKATGFVPFGFTNADNGEDFAEDAGELTKTDVKKAKALWAEAKEELGIDGGDITILASDIDSSKKVSEYLQGVISENLDGLTVKVNAVPFKNRLERSRSGDFDIVLGGWTPVYADPIDFLNLFKSSNSNNFGKWSDPEYDKLLKEASEDYALDNQKRWDSMLKAQELLFTEHPVTPLYQISEVHLVNPKVKGLELGPLGSPYYKKVSITE
ncbi:peptide ABC transporter substrate-binding protein [Carnobacterium mobile]|uniref:peptide ABC transporter substrate-binding protein n=1 Tax=Carnobacterium mobile TaxID=2750 RepID=UPI00054F4F1E|nr:peptide ABC transporter substrate-binding protein [Carnobacterium mobile]